MKNILKTAAICASLVLLVGCEKDEEKATMNANARVESNISASTLVLDKTQSNTTALTVSWETKDLGVQLAPVYTVEFENIATGKSKPLSAERSPFTLTVKELNEYLVGLGLKTGVATDVRVLVRAALSDQRSLVATKTLKVTPYFDEIKASEWGVVGSATPNGWNGPDIKMWNSTDGNLVAYATLSAGEIKFRKNNDWGVNLGGSNGTLSSGGSNIAVTAGTYKITINVSKNTYTIETYSWGIIGSGARGWGDNDDVAMTYEGSTNSWVVKNIALDGEIKFRLNHSWGTNFGADSTDNPATALEGDIKSGGNNIKVTAGTYNVSFSFDANNKGTYKIEKL
ncbi:SusE domain-containing protein [Capnocytophaga leadbetteri]|uniref:SusE domain-containing protein n=1 Tax=Capnocytophaga leadbetteri TaxID=327575 RepID=UPI0026E9BBE4|nr:SusE domain-containing protein [Capnocytophaga leadbetteri]